MNAELTSLLRKRSDAEHEYRKAVTDGDDLAASFRKLTLDELTNDVRRMAGAGFDVDFQQMLATRRSYEKPFEVRALGASARDTLNGGTSFISALSGAMAAAAPLLELATVVNTDTGEDLDFSFVLTLPTPNGIVTDGSTITASDPTFGGGVVGAYGYKDFFDLSNELLSDGKWGIEQWVANRMGPSIGYKLSADLWGGNGSTAPTGLLAGLSTVTAAGAAIVTFDDIAALLNGVPAAYRYNGRCTILLSPGAHVDLMEEQPLYDWASGRLFGFPFRVDAQLADPATTTKSVVAGDFESAFLIRLVPLRVDLDRSLGFNADKSSLRVILRADSKRMVTGAARALVHP